MKTHIKEGCIGCSICADLCPEVFRMGDDGLAEVYNDSSENPDGVKEAAEGCPVAVIVVEE